MSAKPEPGPPRRRAARLEPLIEAIGPPLARSPWSPHFDVQSVEILPVGVSDGRLFWLKPVHAPSLRVALPRSTRAADHVLEVIAWYPLTPIVVHSTSWRQVEGTVVLTYVVVVEPPAALPAGSLLVTPVERCDLARGGSRSAPEKVEVGVVLEHGLRHLAWLVRDDPAVATALEGWAEVLSGYRPEPFRALD